jgi:hypothetical protein
MQSHRRTREGSEAATLGRLRRACGAGEAATAYRELSAWARLQGSINGLRAQGPALCNAIATLERRLFAASARPAWGGRPLVDATPSAARRASRIASDLRPSALPGLNP